ncbi:MAG: M23 family metallopeptidase [Desulfobulbaceae bacterium]
MPDERLHIIITGDAGEGRAFAVSKKFLRNLFMATLAISSILTSGSLACIHFLNQNRSLAAWTEELDNELAATTAELQAVQLDRDRLVTRYEANIFRLQQDRSNLLESSISRLDERSRIIQEIMEHVGIQVKMEEDPGYSGGPFIRTDEKYGEHLISRTDQYLEVLKSLPLGRPVPGAISSGYGKRIDPLIKESAFHPGLDFRGHRGDKIKAAADAVVKKVAYNGDYGRHVILSHGNGFETLYAHMQKALVKEGEKVQRGQAIGLVGSTGRSTGPHLHYGVRHKGKYVDPMKYIRVADLSLAVSN